MELPENWFDILIRFVSAGLLSAVIGFEREMLKKPAGLRTHMLVALGAAGFTVFAFSAVEYYDEQNQQVSFDPLRMVAAIAGGLGFLGAGSIIQARGDVRGMTTAAGIWVAGAIGVGCGSGQYFTVIALTAITFICLVPLRQLEHQLNLKNPPSQNDKNINNKGDNDG